jgi:inosose dehydratase
MQHHSKSLISVATAPVSWGVMEETDTSVWPVATQVIEEIAAAGYQGTELGPFAYYPTDSLSLRAALERHHLTLTSAFVPLRWFQPDRLSNDLESLMNVAGLLASLECPYVVVADGMAKTGEDCPNDAAWRAAAEAMEKTARQLKSLRLQLVFHLEAGSHLATPEDEARLCALTDPDLVGICLDTGHYAYSFGDPRDAIRQYGRRIRYVHLKDVDPLVRDHVVEQGLDFYAAVRAGIFTPLGRGCADIAGVVTDLLALNYRGWVVAEQDVLLPVSQGATPLENARLSRAFLRQLEI